MVLCMYGASSLSGLVSSRMGRSLSCGDLPAQSTMFESLSTASAYGQELSEDMIDESMIPHAAVGIEYMYAVELIPVSAGVNMMICWFW